MNRLNADELRAVKYYEGDIPEQAHADPFWGDAHAYVTLNALLFDGLLTEYTRIREGKRLNPEMLADLPRLVRLYTALCAAAQKGAQTTERLGYRVERAADFRICMKNRMTAAFTSTSLRGFLPSYGDKQEIVLLNCHVPAGLPVIIFADMLDDYRKANEAEMLLPPFLRFTLMQRPLTDADRTITDLNGNPPHAVYDLYFLPGQQFALHTDAAALPDIYAAAKRLFAQIQQHTPEALLDPGDCAAYLHFKQALREQIFGCAGGQDTL